MNSYRNNPDGEENQQAQREHERYVGGLKLQAAAQQTSYFTFGQNHAHAVAGRTFDKDTVVKITAPDPRARMVELFGQKWSMEYNEPPQLVSEGGWFKEIVEL